MRGSPASPPGRRVPARSPGRATVASPTWDIVRFGLATNASPPRRAPRRRRRYVGQVTVYAIWVGCFAAIPLSLRGNSRACFRSPRSVPLRGQQHRLPCLLSFSTRRQIGLGVHMAVRSNVRAGNWGRIQRLLSAAAPDPAPELLAQVASPAARAGTGWPESVAFGSPFQLNPSFSGW